MRRGEPTLLPILVMSHDQLSGCGGGGRLVGPKRRRGTIGIWNAVVRMYARLGRDNKRLANWSHTSCQGIVGERRDFTC